ncbi:protein THYLAKOID ASSEMBLY 8, chloroplastic [Aristolochia californica]|uniref:protein THYLAKOID ASSEMBLY 8, chloroplastic n=1 Tax=Aristolochia californica TaxID=171875 RepID=UPI0035DC1BA1
MASTAAAAPFLSSPLLQKRTSFISCGPRNNRGPLLRGRTLSTEAILAIQSLKRAHPEPTKLDAIFSKTLSRLIKPDLLAALRELLRQNQTHLALQVFALIRRESWYTTDYGLFAEVVSALARNQMTLEIDKLVLELADEGVSHGDDRGMQRLIRALIAAERGKAVVELYGMMKRGGRCLDDYVVKVLIRGLRRLGEAEVADEVQADFDRFEESRFMKPS